MSTKCLSWAIDQTTGSHTRKLVLLLLADLADEQHTCYPGREYLAERAELSDGAVSRALTQLAADGYVRVLRRARRRGGRTSNRYLLLVRGEATPLPDVDDWVSEFAPPVDDDAGQGNSDADAPLPDDDDETAGQGNSDAGAPLPGGGNSDAGAHSTVTQEHVSNKEDSYPLGVTQKTPPPPPTFTHAADDLASAAAATETVEQAREVLRRATVDVDVLRLPTGPERGRLVERVVGLFGAGWSVDQLVDRLLGMGQLATVASVYAVLTSRLGNVGDPPPPAPASNPVGGPALPWCRSPHCDRTTRVLLDDDDRPLYEYVDGGRRPLWCPDCSGR